MTEPTAATESDNHSDLIDEILLNLKQGMEARDRLHTRVAMRVTGLTRGLMVGLGVVVMILFFIVILLGRHLDHMIKTVNTMNTHFTTMTHDMARMTQLVESMEKNVAAMPIIVPEVEQMQADVSEMRSHIGSMSGRITSISDNMVLMGDDMEQMTTTFGVMEHNVRGISSDVNQLSRPMRSFNTLLPFTNP